MFAPAFPAGFPRKGSAHIYALLIVDLSAEAAAKAGSAKADYRAKSNRNAQLFAKCA
jgi:hypothetical protein